MFSPDYLAVNAPGFLELTLGTTVALALRYSLFAGLAWLLAYVVFKNKWFHRKIIARLPDTKDIRRELMYSALTVFVFGLVGALTVVVSKAGWTQMYWRVSDYGIGWFFGSIACAILLHDTYFYWTHRLMHHPRLFRWTHRVHHLSHNPSPWASYAFSPVEAAMQAGIFPITVMVMPIHPFAFILFMSWQITFNVLGHTGYEFHPKWLMDSWLKRLLNTPTNHVMHHEKMAGNYGLYFNIWDRLMGTNHAEYEERYRQVTSQTPEQTTVESRPVQTSS